MAPVYSSITGSSSRRNTSQPCGSESVSSSLSSSLKSSYEDTGTYLSASVSSVSSVDFDSFDNTSYHCTSASTTPWSKLDPSLAIGFYCRTLADFEELCVTIKKVSALAIPFNPHHRS